MKKTEQDKPSKDERDIPRITIDGGKWEKWDHKDNYPTGGGHNGYGGNSNDSGSNWGGGSGGYGNSNTRSFVDSSSASSTYKSIIQITNGAKNGTLLMGERTINLYNGNLTNEDIGVLMQPLQYQGLNLNKFDVSYNKLGLGAVENIFYTFSLQRSNTALYNIKFINLSNNQIGDDGAKYIASHIGNGNYPNLKALDVSGNQISNTGNGYFAESMQGISQGLTVTSAKVQSFSKDAFKSALKGMLYIAKSNGISTKEMLTTDETIDYCKKGIGNVSFNVFTGYLKCTSKVFKLYNYKDITAGDAAGEILGLYSQPIKAVLNFTCITENTAFSIVDQDFANCLVGVDSLLNE